MGGSAACGMVGARKAARDIALTTFRPFVLTFGLVLATSGPLAAQQPATVSVTVTVTDLNSTEGQLIVCLWEARADFPTCRQGDGIPRHVFPVTSTAMRIALPIPRAGRYAVTVFHDANRNGRLGQNFIGMPTEGVGVSNNPGGMPRFASSLVDLAPGGAISVRMRYLFD